MKTNSKVTAGAAVRKIKRHALADEISLEDLSKNVGISRQTLTQHFRRGDMKITEFVALASTLNLNPAAVLREAQANGKEINNV